MKKRILPQDLSDHLVQNGHATRKEADPFVRAFFEVIAQGLQEDKYVKVKGLGTFKLVSVSERESVNISTGERFQISGHTKVSFTPESTMKDLVNRPFAHFETVDLNEDTDTGEFDAIDREAARTLALDLPEGTDSPEAETADDLPADDLPAALPAEETPLSAAPVDEDATAVTPVTPVTPAPPSSSSKAPAAAAPVVVGAAPAAPPTAAQLPAAAQQAAAPHLPEEAPQGAAPQPAAESPDEPASQTSGLQQTSGEEEISVSAPQPITPLPAAGAESLTPANYTYRDTPAPSRRKRWLVRTGLTLLLLLSLTLSYFAGYYRLLCPCTLPWLQPYFAQTEQAEAPRPATPRPTPKAVQSAAPAAAARKHASVPDSVAPSAQPPVATAAQPASTAAPASAPQATQPTGTPSAAAPKAAPSDRQSAPAKPAAAAPTRPATHIVAKGDNLYKISRRYYGTDRYVPAIIKLNHLKDANTITHGQKLRLP